MPLSRKTSTQAQQIIQFAFKGLEQAVAVPHAIQFRNTSIEDVRKACETLENELGARGLLRNMRRLEPLLKGLDCYGKAVDTLCQGTPFLPWIWAPIIVILKIGSDSISAFEALIKAYSKIGQSLSRFESLRIAFENDHGFQEVVAIFYRDITEFHKCAYKFVTINGWRRFFATTWGRFERKFGAIIDNMDRHGELIDKEANARSVVATKALLRQFEAERKDKLDNIVAEQKAETGKFYQAVLARLQINEADQLAIWDTLTIALQEGGEGTCGWVLKQKHVSSWLGYDDKAQFLWLQGAAGTSKSVLAAHLITFRSLSNHIVLRHFCNDLYDSSTKYDQILKSILKQLLEVSDDAIAYAYNLLVTERKSLAISTIELIVQELIAIVSGSLQERRLIWIVVDGVDACDDAALLRCVSLMDSIVAKGGDSHAMLCKVMFTSRHDPPRKGVLKRSLVSLSQESEMIRESIRFYTAQRLRLSPISDRLHQLGLAAEEIVALGDEIATKADGMFLYAKLIIDYLSKQLFRSSLELKEACQELPPKLKGFYRKIVSNITGNLNQASIASVKCILQWIAYTDVPLRKLEILSAVSFTQAGPEVDRLVPSFFLQDCSALMEQKRNNTIGFIHATVKDFLSGPDSPVPITTKSAQRDRAIATVSCLASAATKLFSEEGSFLIVKGLYTFLNYASKHWAEQVLVHTELCSRSGFRDAEFVKALECLADSLNRICVSDGIVTSTAEHIDPRLEYLNDWCSIQTHVNMALLFQSQSPSHLESQTTTHDIPSKAIHFRDPVSVLLQTYRDAVCQILNRGHHLGVTRDEFELFKTQVQTLFYTCRLPYCPRSSIGFETAAKLTLHEIQHSKGFPCRELGCQFPPFRSQKTLNSHTLKYHTQSVSRRGLKHMKSFYNNKSAENAQGPATPTFAQFPMGSNNPVHSQTNDNDSMVDFPGMEFANPLNTGDVLNDFDFDSYLHDNNGTNEAFDFEGTFSVMVWWFAPTTKGAPNIQCRQLEMVLLPRRYGVRRGYAGCSASARIHHYRLSAQQASVASNRIVESAVEMSLPKMRSIGEGGITLGYSCTGEYSFPLIKFSSSAGETLQGFLTGGDLLIYHIFTRLAANVRTRIILDEPTAIQPFTEYTQSVRCRPIVIRDSQSESQDIDTSDDEQETRDAAQPTAAT
ncbi:hypothetical protein NLG97_g8410 [Lecanicillium saksenae]|uniref:Uncharacterized protein n=1 Tax=Lecanicillium saksenae TaxID=468837 RepID=A0ACC1QK68_9HYPO|nr:hypothetical protein NLG97_g8410 [Lecanicillium saksenae]